MLPGIIILTSLIGLSILRITTLQEVTEKEKADWLGILAIILGLLLSVAAISMARGAFGPVQAKSSRYAEVPAILAPLTWVLFHSATNRITNKIYKNAFAAVILLLLVAPFYNDFRLRTTYSMEFEKKLATQQCIRKYYAGQGDGGCWMTFPAFIGDRLDLARERGIIFSRELN
jgi:hypothetical protein